MSCGVAVNDDVMVCIGLVRLHIQIVLLYSL
jgi:hypothetical protein